MESKILDGVKLANRIVEEVKNEINKLKIQPHLVVISVGEDESSSSYIKRKEEIATKVGMIFTHLHYKKTTTEDLINKVSELSQDKNVHGIIVQLPLPEGINEHYISQAIIPWKDVDGFNPYNKGMLDINQTQLIPPTAKGIHQLLRLNSIDLRGMNTVVIGKGEIAGKPIAKILMNEGATVTICDENTKNLSSFTKDADLIVTAVGKENLITVNDIKEGVILINVGISWRDGKVYGDFDFDKMKEKASYITPTPGGTGPLTVALLISNTLLCYKLVEKMK